MQLLNSLNKVKMRKSRIRDTLMILTVTVQFREGNFSTHYTKIILTSCKRSDHNIAKASKLYYSITHGPIRKWIKVFPELSS